MGADLWSEWWVWMAAALALGILEMVVPAYIFLGFAVGAFGVGAALALGWSGVTGPWALVVFAGLSLAAYVVLRQVFGRRRGQVKIWDRDINDN